MSEHETDLSARRRLANLLGALGLGIADRLAEVTSEGCGHSGETAAALVTVGTEENCTITELAHTLELSHPGTVRLIDRLDRDGLVTRRAGIDARQRRLALTDAGRERRSAILEARTARLMPLLAGLDSADQRAFERIVDHLLMAMVSSRAESETLCRLCDVEVCAERGCPIDRKLETLP